MQPKEIVKRDGRVVPFAQERITNAIFKAAQAVGGSDRSLAERLAREVTEEVARTYAERPPTVEEVQEVVEKVLIENGHAKTAKAYILYRHQRREFRDFYSLMVNVQDMVQEYLDVEDWRVHENSNMNYSLQGLNNHIVTAVTSKYWLEKVYPPEIARAHQEGSLHLHDLGLLAPYCVGWDLEDLLRQGFRGAPGKVESAPPRHFRSALGQVNNFLFSAQGETAGAQAFSSFDTYLAPFIRADGLDYRGVKQAIQEFIFNLNVPTRVGFQTPFVNLTLDVSVPGHMREEPIILGGEYQDTTYGEYQEEMDLLNQAFCEVMTEGDARGRIFTFPIPTYNITADFPWDSPVVEKIMAMTAKYGIPYFSNFVNSDLDPTDIRSMCCRLSLDLNELKKRGGGLFGANPLTGSIGVVTLNLPRLAYLSADREEFFRRVRGQMELAKKSLLIKRSVLEKLTEQGLYPYSRFYLRSVKERFGQYWTNHFNTIGLIGMHEAAHNLEGSGIDSARGQDLATATLDFMREQLARFQEETGEMFNLEATPAEGASYRLARMDREQFPDIIASGSLEPYYTNSTQLPVDGDLDLFQALEHQEELQTRYTGGTVYHAYVGERLPDPDSCRRFLQTVTQRFRVPYVTLTPTFSICPNHGYLVGEQWHCPTCGEEAEVWSRIVGYYRPVQNWNQGKKEEFKERKLFASTPC